MSRGRIWAISFVFRALLGPAGVSASAQDMLLIPDSATDSVGMYSVNNGDYLGDLIIDADPTPGGDLDTPICAIRGPDGVLYVSDQTRDRVVRYQIDGQFLDVFCDSASGLDNPRGLAFLGSNLLVCYASTSNSADRGVAQYDPSGQRLANLISDGADPFDVFVAGSTLLVSDIAGNAVSRYGLDGVFQAQIFSVDFPEQIAFRNSDSRFINIAHDGNRITEFDTTAAFDSTAITGLGRGIFPLTNGHLLFTNSNSVREINPSTGIVVRVIRSGAGFRFIERLSKTSTGCALPGCDGGDLDGNCAVELADLTELLAHYGESGVPGSVIGDTNFDGAVDLIDLTSLLSQYGNVCSP